MKIVRPLLSVCLMVFLGFCFVFGAGCSKKAPVTYCGEQEEGGSWSGCDPDRYNVDGPAERLLDQGVSKIIMIDLTVGGARFAKTFDVVQMTKRAIAAWEQRQAVSEEAPVAAIANKIGVLFVVHGGFRTYQNQYLWDASAQMFSYDINHPVHRFFLFNQSFWGSILTSGNAVKELDKYAFEYERLGGTDPFPALTDKQLQDLTAELERLGEANSLEFAVDWACWMCGDDIDNYPFPRFMGDPDGQPVEIPAADPAIPFVWVNDYQKLMERSYPAEPQNWTRSLGLPDEDRAVDLAGGTNPVAVDPDLAALFVEAIEAGWSGSVPDNQTAVVLLNHALHDHNEVFDPKIDDTLIVNKNIKAQLLERHPAMDADNIIGAYMGIKEENPDNGKVERSREMRGENLGDAWLYESDKQLPGDEWGYRYWDALEYLKKRGVQHIVIGFPQIVTDSVLSLVEQHNQIAKEIGFKTWLYAAEGDYSTYPDVGHPFADYWGMWVDTECGGEPCCFEMGGCADGRPYPPPRQTPADEKRDDMDPSLAYDISEYGHLGYDSELGAPDPNAPVQEQYTGTWAYYRPPSDDPRVGQLLAKHVLNMALDSEAGQAQK
ncbi:MAG: hypothetical protein GY868_12855 [Deltaproteobacteria bacterium]|nr:hypothetical protein [Deltaproteobacteria bacterium]